MIANAKKLQKKNGEKGRKGGEDFRSMASQECDLYFIMYINTSDFTGSV